MRLPTVRGSYRIPDLVGWANDRLPSLQPLDPAGSENRPGQIKTSRAAARTKALANAVDYCPRIDWPEPQWILLV